jgi:hypothetical protein
MTYALPADLAELIIDQWHTYVSRAGAPPPPAIPRQRQLRWILETIFFASLEREEGRELKFTVCCGSRPILRDGSLEQIPLIPFITRRPLSVASLRSLAPAVRPDAGAILVELLFDFDDREEANIVGVLHVGGDYANARAGKSFYYQQPPFALTVEVRGPGELHVYQGAIKLAILNSGVLEGPNTLSALDYFPAHEILKDGEDKLMSRINPPAHEPPSEWATFQWIALLNCVLSVVNSIKANAHGGTLLLIQPSNVEQMPLRFKYELTSDANFLDDRFISFINTRHEVGDAFFMQENNLDGVPSSDEIAKLQLTLVAKERELGDAVGTVAMFSGVDGALALTSDLRVLGFGAEILLEKAAPTQVFEVFGETFAPKQTNELDSESFGMRHRSAVRFVGSVTGAVAFVVSQDGRVSLCWNKDGTVYIKRGVNIANPNMAGA